MEREEVGGKEVGGCSGLLREDEEEEAEDEGTSGSGGRGMGLAGEDEFDWWVRLGEEDADVWRLGCGAGDREHSTESNKMSVVSGSEVVVDDPVEEVALAYAKKLSLHSLLIKLQSQIRKQ